MTDQELSTNNLNNETTNQETPDIKQETSGSKGNGSYFMPAKPKRAKKALRTIIVVIVIVGLLGGGFWWWKNHQATPVIAQENLMEYTVSRGNVTHMVSGPGTVSPVKIFTVATNLTGDILEDYFEEGDEVEKDSLLFQLDDETTSLNFDAAKDTLSNAQDNYETALRNKHDLNTYAIQSGLISAIYVKKGDSVNVGSKVADIIDTGSMLLTIPFNSADAANLIINDLAQVFLDDFDLILSGYVRKVASGQSVSATGALTTNVEIIFTNPGAISPGAFATAVVGEYACNNVGYIEYAVADTIYATGSGKIIDLTVNAGDHIKAGQKILTLENTTVDDALTRASKSIGDAEKKLTNTQNNLQITSPIAGTVLAKSAKAGDTLYNTSTTLAVVADMSCLIFSIEVDELEIRYVEAGQQASITADAYEGEFFSGIVTNVGKTGTSSNGVTTYPVTIEIAQYGGLLPGMNVNADIVVREAQNVLYVPVDAITRGNLVLVKDDNSEENNQPWPMRTDGQGEGQQWPTRGDGQGEGQQWPTRGDGQGEGQQRPMRGDDQGEGQQRPIRGDGQSQDQGSTQQRIIQDDSQGNDLGSGQSRQMPDGQTRIFNQGDGQIRISQDSGLASGFMGVQAPEGYVYRRVETGISDSNYVEIISGLHEGDTIAYRPAVRDSGNMNFNMFMGPGGGTVMFNDRGGGTTMRQAMPIMRQ